MDPVLKARAAKTESIVMRLRAPRPVPVHHRYAARFMRRIRSVFNNGLDNVGGEPFEMARSSMTRVLSLWHVEAALLLIEICFRLYRIFERPKVFAKGPQQSFSFCLFAHPHNLYIEHALARMRQ